MICSGPKRTTGPLAITTVSFAFDVRTSTSASVRVSVANGYVVISSDCSARRLFVSQSPWRKTSPTCSVQFARTSSRFGGCFGGACSIGPTNCRSTDSTVVTGPGSIR